MNKIFKINFSIVMLMMLIMSSCLKKEMDNYKPDLIKDLELNTSLNDSYLVNVGTILILDATLPEPQNRELTYKWYYYPADANSTVARKEVGQEAKLALDINMATGNYYLFAEATDVKTGVKGYKKIALSVKRLTSEGWLLLTYKNSKTNLSIVSSSNEVYKDFMPSSVEYPMTSKPEKLFCINDWDAKTQPIIIKTDQPNLYFLNYNTFEINNDAKDAFSAGLNVEATYFGTDSYYNIFYMWDKSGMVYKINRGGQLNYPSGFNLPILGNYKASEFVIPVSSSNPIPAVFFDEKGKRFMFQRANGNELFPFQAKSASAPFDVSNFSDQIKFADVGASDITYVVGRNSAGEHSLYSMAFNNSLNVYPAMAVNKLDIPTDKTPTFYTLSGKLPLLYYILDNTLYLYKMGEKISVFQYKFPSGETVAAMSMLRGSPFFTIKDNPAVDNRLAVATNSAQGGVFYTFDLNATGTIKAGSFGYRVDGLDPIVDIAYKVRK